MPEEKQKSWFKRHWFLSGILGFFLFLIIIGMFQGIGEGFKENAIKNSNSQNGLIIASSNLLVPQDLEVDRIWRINDIEIINENATGFIEGAERKISKVESLESTHITTKAYCFDSIDSADQFYNQEKTTIDIRGVEEWSIGNDCFGIKKDVVLSGYAKGFCLRENVVFYIESTSSSYRYASDGKEFMNIMLKKV